MKEQQVNYTIFRHSTQRKAWENLSGGLAFPGGACYNKDTKTNECPRRHKNRKTPGEFAPLRGSPYGVGLLPFSAPVKPLADIVGRYTRCDGHQETNEQLHANTSFLLPEWSYVWAATQLYHISTHGTRNRRLSTPLFSPQSRKSPLYFWADCGIMMLPKSLPLFPVWREGQHLLGVNAFGRAYCSLPYPSSCGKNPRGIRHSLGRARGSASLYVNSRG